jgi:hypothetical protein
MAQRAINLSHLETMANFARHTGYTYATSIYSVSRPPDDLMHVTQGKNTRNDGK